LSAAYVLLSVAEIGKRRSTMTVEGDGVFSALREHRIARRHVLKYGFASSVALSAAPSLSAVVSAAAVSAPSSHQSIGMRPQAETPRFDGLTLKMSTGDTYLEIFKMYADEVKEKFGVEFAYTMPAAQEMYQKDMLEFASGASTHDVVLFQPAWLPDYAPHLADLGALSEEYGLDFHMDDALDVFRSSYTTWEGTFLAVPIDADQHNFYYNRMAFEDERNREGYQAEHDAELAVPETWDQYVQVAEFFNGRDWDFDGEPEYGVVEAWQRGGFAWYWWQSKFFGYGGIYFDEEMNPLINSPAGVKALEVQMAIKDFVPPGIANFGSPEARNAFMNGEAPMVVHWTSTAKLSKDPEASKIVDQVGIAMVPGVADGDTVYRRPALPTGWSAGIPKYSNNIEAAVRILEFYLQPDRSKAIALNPDTWSEPWRTSSFDPEVWREQWPDDPEYGEAVINVMQETLELGVPDLQIPGQDEYVKVADAEISGALTGTKSAQQALDDAAAEWNNITDRLDRNQQLAYWTQQLQALRERGIEYRPELAGSAS
jgi:multiple sugar transport system substrate-binding protein